MYPEEPPYDKRDCNNPKVDNNVEYKRFGLNKGFIILKINLLRTDELNSLIIEHFPINNEEDYSLYNI